MASPKQVNYALALLSDAGYSTGYMNSQFKELGATMRERSGTVESWLNGMNSPTISRLIDRLKRSNPTRRTNPTKAQRVSKARKASVQRRVALALAKYLKQQNPGQKLAGAKVEKLKGGVLKITPIKANAGRKIPTMYGVIHPGSTSALPTSLSEARAVIHAMGKDGKARGFRIVKLPNQREAKEQYASAHGL